MADGRRARGGFLAVVGYLLSPLSWWNDAFINIPLAYVFAVLVSLLHRPLFPYAMVLGYWFTNVLGLVLMHAGGREVLGKEKGSRSQGVEGSREPTAPSKRLWRDVAIGTAYSAAITALAFTGVLRPPAALMAKLRGAGTEAQPSPTESPVHFAREEIEMRIRPSPLPPLPMGEGQGVRAVPMGEGQGVRAVPVGEGRGVRTVVEITGTYHFRSETDKAVVAGIFYPFPLDSTLSYPDSVAIPGFRFERGDSGVMFRMRFPPRSETSFVAWYRQPLHAKSARYIVTTTRKWGRAIDRAQFTITVPRGFAGVELSYKPDRTDRTDSTVVYRFTRTSFYPDHDVVVTWR